MKLIKYFIVLSLCFFLCSCPVADDRILEIDIGDYEGQLAAWNNQNMLDYQIYVRDKGGYQPEEAFITVKNDIPEYSVPSYWLEENRKSTILEFFSLIKRYEKILTDAHNEGDSRSFRLEVQYNTEYHYPIEITSKVNRYITRQYIISLMPFEEGELEIDIGDYENQLAMWNNQNMLDYKIKVIRWKGDYSYDNPYGFSMIFNVKNGNAENGIYEDDMSISSIFRYKNTIPEIYDFIKQEEERIRNEYNGTYHSYLKVQYDTEYHYPIQINTRIGHLFGKYEQWEITLMPH
jgi:hypothetical protein